MKTDKRFWIYTAMSIVAFVLSAYAVRLGFEALAVTSILLDFLVFLVAALVFAVSGVALLYFALSFKFGIVEEVFGSRNSATLVLAGKEVRAGGRIRYLKHLETDDESIGEDEKTVFFIVDWRPWVCVSKNFRLDS